MTNTLTQVTLYLPEKTMQNIAKLTEAEHAKLPNLPPPSTELIIGMAVAAALERQGIEPEAYPLTSDAAKALRSIPSERRADVSRENGKKPTREGERPRGRPRKQPTDTE